MTPNTIEIKGMCIIAQNDAIGTVVVEETFITWNHPNYDDLRAALQARANALHAKFPFFKYTATPATLIIEVPA